MIHMIENIDELFPRVLSMVIRNWGYHWNKAERVNKPLRVHPQRHKGVFYTRGEEYGQLCQETEKCCQLLYGLFSSWTSWDLIFKHI